MIYGSHYVAGIYERVQNIMRAGCFGSVFMGQQLVGEGGPTPDLPRRCGVADGQPAHLSRH